MKSKDFEQAENLIVSMIANINSIADNKYNDKSLSEGQIIAGALIFAIINAIVFLAIIKHDWTNLFFVVYKDGTFIDVCKWFANLSLNIIYFILLPVGYIALIDYSVLIYNRHFVKYMLKLRILNVCQSEDKQIEIELVLGELKYHLYISETEILELDELIIQSRQRIKEILKQRRLQYIQNKLRTNRILLSKLKGIFK
jgi:hypothetical protein